MRVYVYVCVCERERERQTDRNRVGQCPCLRAYVRVHISTKLRIELHIFSLPKLYIILTSTL